MTKALQNYNAWLTGANTLPGSTDIQSWIKWDKTHQIPRFNPLSRWTQEEVWSYLKHHGLPIHGSMLAAVETGETRALDSALWWKNQTTNQEFRERHIA
jgi:3'-phosphoadenosine 5'-phosphosulfate sulfotransferase (PAPS reductase)/FAD synthetase